MKKISIIIVNGFPRKDLPDYPAEKCRLDVIQYPWIDICLRQVQRHSNSESYEVYIYDDARLESHRQIMANYPNIVDIYPQSLEEFDDGSTKNLPTALNFTISRLRDNIEYFILLDTDAFPIRDNWLDIFINLLNDGAPVVCVCRDEKAPRLKPFAHVCCLCMRKADFLKMGVWFYEEMAIAGAEFNYIATLDWLERGAKIVGLQRSNVKKYHDLMGGVYGNLVYHQAAVNRFARFRTASNEVDMEHEFLRVKLRDAIFQDLDALIEEFIPCPYNAIAQLPIPPIDIGDTHPFLLQEKHIYEVKIKLQKSQQRLQTIQAKL